MDTNQANGSNGAANSDELQKALKQLRSEMEREQKKRSIEAAKGYIKSTVDRLKDEEVLALAQSLQIRAGLQKEEDEFEIAKDRGECPEPIQAPRLVRLNELLGMVVHLEKKEIGDPVQHETLKEWILAGTLYLRDSEINGFVRNLKSQGLRKEEAELCGDIVRAWRARWIDAQIHAKVIRDVYAAIDEEPEEAAFGLAKSVEIVRKTRDSLSTDRDQLLREMFAMDKRLEHEASRRADVDKRVEILTDKVDVMLKRTVS